MKKAISMILCSCLLAPALGHSIEKGPEPWIKPYWYVSFNLSRQAWHATDIIIVNEGEKIDGKVTVEEVLRGSKIKGEELEFPGLAELAAPEARTRYVPDPGLALEVRAIHPFDRASDPMDGWKKAGVIPGNRMILFLGGGGDEIVERYRSGTAEVPPKPEVKASPITRNVALIDGEQVFAASGKLDAPNLPFMDLGVSLREVREIVKETQEGQESIKRCLAVEDAKTRAAEAASLTESTDARVHTRGLEIMFGCGAEAIPHIQDYLDKNGSDPVARLLQDVRASEWKARPDFPVDENFIPPLIYLADREVEFWRRTTPTLEVNWWNEEKDNPQRQWRLQQRDAFTAKVVRALGAIGTPEALAKVAEMRDFCKTQPRLLEENGPELYRACLATLGELPVRRRG